MSDRRKVLEALVAKRKAEAESGEKHKRKSISSMTFPTKKPAIGDKRKVSPLKKKGKLKEKEKPKPKPKRVSKMDKYETDEEEETEEEEEEEEDTTSDSGDDDEDSEDEETYKKKKPVKKPVLQSKGRAPVKGLGSGQNIKVKDEKEKGFLKGKEKPKSKAAKSSDEDDEGDLSDESLHGVDPNNIIRDRSRRRTLQPTIYQYDVSSDDESDDDSD